MVPQESVDAHHHAWSAEPALGTMAFGNPFLKNEEQEHSRLRISVLRNEMNFFV